MVKNAPMFGAFVLLRAARLLAMSGPIFKVT